jgi:predicted nuclease with TOPRIM domain
MKRVVSFAFVSILFSSHTIFAERADPAKIEAESSEENAKIIEILKKIEGAPNVVCPPARTDRSLPSSLRDEIQQANVGLEGLIQNRNSKKEELITLGENLAQLETKQRALSELISLVAKETSRRSTLEKAQPDAEALEKYLIERFEKDLSPTFEAIENDLRVVQRYLSGSNIYQLFKDAGDRNRELGLELGDAAGALIQHFAKNEKAQLVLGELLDAIYSAIHFRDGTTQREIDGVYWNGWPSTEIRERFKESHKKLSAAFDIILSVADRLKSFDSKVDLMEFKLATKQLRNRVQIILRLRENIVKIQLANMRQNDSGNSFGNIGEFARRPWYGGERLTDIISPDLTAARLSGKQSIHNWVTSLVTREVTENKQQLEKTVQQKDQLIKESNIDSSDFAHELENVNESLKSIKSKAKQVSDELQQLQVEAETRSKRAQELDTKAESFVANNPVVEKFFKVETPQKLSEEKKKIYEVYEQGLPIAFEKITELLISDEVDAFNKTHNDNIPVSDVSEFFQSLSKQIGQTDLSPSGYKSLYESLMSRFPGRPLRYNIASDNLVDVCKRDRAQCHSGTLFLQAFLRQYLGAKKFREKHLVVIHTPGHVLSGWMSRDKDQDWALTGTESTVEGQARVPFKKVRDLKGPIRIVDADLWMLAYVFRNEISDRDNAVKKALELTAEKYGIDLARFEYKNLKGTGRDPAHLLFSFGHADVPPGDQDRAKASQINANSILDDAPRTPEHFEKAKESVVNIPGEGPAQELLQKLAEERFEALQKERPMDLPDGMFAAADLFDYDKDNPLGPLAVEYIKRKLNYRYEIGKHSYELAGDDYSDIELLITDIRTRKRTIEVLPPMISSGYEYFRNLEKTPEAYRNAYEALLKKAQNLKSENKRAP